MDGLMALSSDCTKYLECTNGISYVRKCATGTVFDPSLETCNWPQNVHGCEGIIIKFLFTHINSLLLKLSKPNN